MRIDLPLCGLKPCRYCFDGNCAKKSEYDRCEYQAYRTLGPVEELSALAKTWEEGRAVVLDTPRKPLVWGDDDHDTCLCPDCGKDLMGLYDSERIVLQCPVCGQYLDTTKIITRAEADAALNGGGGDVR